MEEFRFIDLEVHSAFVNMAIDEAIMLSMKEGKVGPTLRLYRWHPTAVSIGIFQGMEDEVDIDFCKSQDIDVIRRITGGGAVYHDYNGEITYSIILPKGHRLAPDDIIESYKIICSGVVVALSQLGIDSEFKAINDVVTGEKKISGNAQTRHYSCILQHGTVLRDLDVHSMFQALKVPSEKISDKMIEDVKQRVTSIKDVLGYEISMNELKNALEFGFSKALGINLIPGYLTEEENETAQRLAEEKYSSDDWNFKR
jgi:lipoyltransferase/lipoate-protein ligase